MQGQTLTLQNQYGETSKNMVVGGSGDVSCSFIVDPTNANGLGERTLVATGPISAVYMHTSSTPSAGNPNPAVGYILVQLSQAFAGFLNAAASILAPASGTPINVTTGLSVGGVYVITALGTTTATAWQALGLPASVTPAVGAAFVAITATVGSGTGAVQVPAAAGSGVGAIEVVGDPNTTVIAATGGQILLACYAPTSSSVTTRVATAPAAGSKISLAFNFLPAAGSPL